MTILTVQLVTTLVAVVAGVINLIGSFINLRTARLFATPPSTALVDGTQPGMPETDSTV